MSFFATLAIFIIDLFAISLHTPALPYSIPGGGDSYIFCAGPGL